MQPDPAAALPLVALDATVASFPPPDALAELDAGAALEGALDAALEGAAPLELAALDELEELDELLEESEEPELSDFEQLLSSRVAATAAVTAASAGRRWEDFISRLLCLR